MELGGNNMFDIAKFNKLITQGDLLGLEYLKPFIPSELEERYNNILTLNYVNNCCEQGKIEGNIFDIYTKNNGLQQLLNRKQMIIEIKALKKNHWYNLRRRCSDPELLEGKKKGKCKVSIISMDGAYRKATINVTVE